MHEITSPEAKDEAMDCDRAVDRDGNAPGMGANSSANP